MRLTRTSTPCVEYAGVGARPRDRRARNASGGRARLSTGGEVMDWASPTRQSRTSCLRCPQPLSSFERMRTEARGMVGTHPHRPRDDLLEATKSLIIGRATVREAVDGHGRIDDAREQVSHAR